MRTCLARLVMGTKAVLQMATEVAEAGARVVNISMGYNTAGCASAATTSNVRKLVQSGKAMFRQLFAGQLGSKIVWTASAGNSCAEGPFSAWAANGDLSNVISVAASNSDGNLASFSNFGAGVEIAAPGGVSVPPGTVGVWSASTKGCDITRTTTCRGYEALSGTSMAAPIVAGIAAVIRSAAPWRSAASVGDCITRWTGDALATRSALPASYNSRFAYAQNSLRIVDAAAAVACSEPAPVLTPAAPSPPVPTPTYPGGTELTGALVVEGGDQHSCALLRNRTLKCWGYNAYGQTGTGVFSTTPVAVPGIADVSAVSAGSQHTCALRSDGTVACWGRNSEGALGNGTTTDAAHPTTVPGISDAVGVSTSTSGYDHSCAVLRAGTVKCWGYNGYGELGDGTRERRLTPVAVSGLTDAVSVAAGAIHTCALRQTLQVVCWGYRSWAPVEEDPVALVPQRITGLDDAIAVASGGGHSCAVRLTARVVCWGVSSKFSVGTPWEPEPIEVPGIANATSVIAGYDFSCALLSSGGVKCWGGGWTLGNGSVVPSRSPVDVIGVSDAVTIGGHGRHACAVLANWKAVCWGSNENGQLGNGVQLASPVPVPVGLL